MKLPCTVGVKRGPTANICPKVLPGVNPAVATLHVLQRPLLSENITEIKLHSEQRITLHIKPFIEIILWFSFNNSFNIIIFVSKTYLNCIKSDLPAPRESPVHKTGVPHPVRLSKPSATNAAHRVWMWHLRVILLKLTTNKSLINVSGPGSVSGLLSSRSNCRCSSSVDASHTGTKPRYMSSEAKRLRSENMTVKKIGTHNGTFHCDEVLACFFLRQLPDYKVRTESDYKWVYCSLCNCNKK